jgi:uncharacterized protein (TIGR02453 family)
MENVMLFLKELARNNNREWFQTNKKWYDESRGKIFFLTDVLINEIRKFDSTISALNPSDCLFRIFRDVRFSHDKSPYKTNFGSFIAKGGKKAAFAGYYIHIEPESSFVGGGIYMPDNDTLKILRNYIAENGDEFFSIINETEFKTFYPELYDDKLKTAPKGFDSEHEYIELLKYKSFAFTHKMSDDDVLNEKYIENIVLAFRQLYKANVFLNSALKK